MSSKMNAAHLPTTRRPQTHPKRSVHSMRLDSLLTKAFSHLLLIICTIIVVYPVVWMLFASLKTQSELVTNIWGLPQSAAWDNYVGAWRRARLGYALFNSVFVSVSVTTLILILSALAGYAFAKLRLRFANLVFLTFVFTMQAGAPIIPLYIMLAKMGLSDTYAGLILVEAAGGIPLSVFIFRAFFQTVPTELLDAARVDGCTELGVFGRVVLPISGPAVATVTILQFLNSWNSYFLPLILIRSPQRATIPLAIQVFFYEWGRTTWVQVFAALCVGSIPMIILYVIMQRQFIQGLTQGSLKG